MVDVLELEGCREMCSVFEFKEYLNHDYLSSKENSKGWVFWWPERAGESSEYGSNNINNSSVSQVFGESIQERIRLALDKLTSDYCKNYASVAQFWAPKVIGERCYLRTLDQPFSVNRLSKGSGWYRGECMNRYYIIDDEAKEEEVGPPGRVFRSGHPESSIDLRLYSVKEFPLRDQAVHSGFTTYLALPLFDLCSQNQCIGVLEIVSSSSYYDVWVEFLHYHEAIKEAQLISTHGLKRDINILTENTKPQREISEMLQLAIQVLPQLNLVQVWVPCTTCTNSSNHLSCMERLAFKTAFENNFWWKTYGTNMQHFLDAGRFHNLQVGKGIAGIALSSTNKLCFCRNLSSLSIIQYPLVHYAQKANLSFGFSICLRSVDNENDLYVFEFYLHIREDARTWSFLHLLLKIMEMKLQSFEVETGRQLGDELIVEVCKKNMLTSSAQEPSNVGYEIIQHGQAKQHQYLKEFTIAFVMPMERCQERYSISDFKASLKVADLSCLEVSNKPSNGWHFCSSKVLSEAEVNDNSQLLPNPIQEKIKTFFMAMTSKWDWGWNRYCLVQFWAPKMIECKFYLSTSDQPFALSILCKGLCSYRKRCMEHPYFIGEGAKEEEVGPPGRVFQSGHPESSPDLRLYSVKEFSLQEHAAHCGLRSYLALPVFDSNQMQCAGVLEFVEYGDFEWNGLKFISAVLQEAHLMSTPFCFWASIQQESNPRSPDNDEGRKQAFREIHEMLSLVIKSPELCLAQVWVPCTQFANKSDDWRCMKRAAYECDFSLKFCVFLDICYSNQLVQIGNGVAGMALGSENRSCFCRNLCDFSITEQPLAHYAQRSILDICFAICLKSSYTNNTLYVLEFFLRSSIVQGGYPQSLNSLLLIMKQKLKSFKVASGQDLGEELVVDVIESGKEKKLSESTYTDVFPIRFNIIQSSQEMEHEHSRNKQVHSDHNGMNISEAEQSDVAAAIANKEVMTNKTKRSRKETSFHIDRGDLEPHFGKRLEDVARELGVGKSTVKRACRKFGIERWPGNEINKKNPSLFLKENAVNQVQVGVAETSIASGTNIPPLYLIVHQNKPHTDTESTQQRAEICPETDVMMVKAKFKDDTIKFQLRVSSGMEKLKEEVNKRLNLKIGSFKLKYLDEGDDDWILLACEDDLQFCVKNLTALGKTYIQVMVQLISP